MIQEKRILNQFQIIQHICPKKQKQGALYHVKNKMGKPIYDLSYEEISNERATYEIPEPAYNFKHRIYQ